MLFHRHKATPYLGQKLRGVVETTYLRGRKSSSMARSSAARWANAPAGRFCEASLNNYGMNVHELNALPPGSARATLLRCCGSRSLGGRHDRAPPFVSVDKVYHIADDIWASLDRADWLEAFAAHPRIGDLGSLRRKFASTAEWASGEQAGVAGAGDDIIMSLAEGNRDYEAKFGYIFIVCATGKTAAEMLALLRSRLGNDPVEELRIAAAEQAKITRLRLEKL